MATFVHISNLIGPNDLQRFWDEITEKHPSDFNEIWTLNLEVCDQLH